MTTKRILHLCFALCAASLLEAQQSRYLLSVESTADLNQILSSNRLILERPLRTSPKLLYLVSSAQPLSASTLSAIQRAKGVVEFEHDEPLTNRNATPNQLIQPSLADLGDALTRRDNTILAGAIVRSTYANQPAGDLIGIPGARRLFPTGAHIVAIIDTGVDASHPALKQVVSPGYDFLLDKPGIASDLAGLTQSTVAILDGVSGPAVASRLNQSTVAILDQSTVAILDNLRSKPSLGHGTMIAGLIHLVAPTAQIMPLRVFDLDGSARLSHIIQAIYYATDHGAKVINMSFSVMTSSTELEKAVAYAISKGVICVASAGNEGREITSIPAAYPGVIGVGSINKLQRRSVFSNYGVRSAEFSAPGEALITTYPGGNYAGVWGTSFSTALTSGTAAIMLQINLRMTPGKAQDAFDKGRKISQGMGDARLDLPLSLLFCMLAY